MHDFHLADQIAKLVMEHAKKNNLSKVTKIVVELGHILEHDELIKEENLKFNIKLLLKNTIAKDAEIAIIPKESQTWVLKEIEGE